MEAKKQKTVRLGDLVKKLGEPKQVTLWTKPEEDQEFMKVVSQDRVVTLVQRNVGTKKDYGLVGFFERPKAAFIVFPKAIPHPKETKVVGIQYDAITQPEVKGPIFKPEKVRPVGIPMAGRQTSKKAPAHKEPALFHFRSFVELTARQRVPVVVQARSAKEAARLIQAKASELQMDPGESKISRKIGKPAKQNLP